MQLNPAALSKINWTQVIAAAATVGAVFGLNLTPEQQASAVTMIALVGQGVTVIFRTFFTGNAKPS